MEKTSSQKGHNLSIHDDGNIKKEKGTIWRVVVLDQPSLKIITQK